MVEIKKYISWRLQPVTVMSNKGVFIDYCSPKATTILLKKKLVRIISINPFTVQMNCEHENQIQEAEDFVKSKLEEKEIKNKKYSDEYYNKIKASGRKKAPRKGRRKKSKEQEETTRKFFNSPTKKEANKLYRDKNIEKIDDYEFKRAESGTLTKEQINEIGDKQEWCCFYCTKDVKQKYSKDHYMPISLGGLTNKKNVVICCKRCNYVKGKKTPLDFYKYVLLYGIKGYIYENSLFFKRIIKEQKKTKKKQINEDKILPQQY